MIKVTSGKYTFTFNDGTTEEEQQETIKRCEERMRADNGNKEV